MGEPKTVQRELEVRNQYGIHARPAALLVKAAGRFGAEIFLGIGDNEVSAKSIMGLLTLEGRRGAQLTVRAVGEDAEEAVAEIVALFEQKFFED